MNTKQNNDVAKIDASGLFYRELNARLRGLLANGTQQIELHNIYGQRYIPWTVWTHTEFG